MSRDLFACIAETLTDLELVPAGETIDASTGLLGRGIGLDSIEALRLVAALEERLALTIDDEDLTPEAFDTVASLARFVSERLP